MIVQTTGRAVEWGWKMGSLTKLRDRLVSKMGKKIHKEAIQTMETPLMRLDTKRNAVLHHHGQTCQGLSTRQVCQNVQNPETFRTDCTLLKNTVGLLMYMYIIHWWSSDYKIVNAVDWYIHVFKRVWRVRELDSHVQGRKKTFEIQLPSKPVHFSFQLPPLEYYLPNRCAMFIHCVSY